MEGNKDGPLGGFALGSEEVMMEAEENTHAKALRQGRG